MAAPPTSPCRRRRSTWNIATDTLICADKQAPPEAIRPWMLWDRGFEVAPEESKRLVQGPIATSAAETASPRRTGATIRALAVAYQHTGDRSLLKVSVAVYLGATFAARRGPPQIAHLKLRIRVPLLYSPIWVE